MSKLTKLASTMPFAHYLGFNAAAPVAAVAEEDEDRKQRADESDDDYAKRMEQKDEEEEAARKAEEEKKEEEARKAEEERKEEEARQARRADGDDDDADMEEKDDADDKEEGKRAGRAKGARQRERIRCARIVAAGIKLGRVNQACSFAFDSTLTAPQAVAALNAAALDGPVKTGARGTSLDQRMAAQRQQANPGASGGAAPKSNPAAALADRIVAIGEQTRLRK